MIRRELKSVVIPTTIGTSHTRRHFPIVEKFAREISHFFFETLIHHHTKLAFFADELDVVEVALDKSTYVFRHESTSSFDAHDQRRVLSTLIRSKFGQTLAQRPLISSNIKGMDAQTSHIQDRSGHAAHGRHTDVILSEINSDIDSLDHLVVL